MFKRLLQWDRDTFLYLNGLGIESYDGFWTFVTNIANWIPIYIVFFILLYVKYPKKQASVMATTTVLLLFFILFVVDQTKDLVARLRPNNDEEINSLIRILKTPVGFSFFSGHAATSFAITTLIVLFLRKKIKWIWIFYLWPMIFSFSRIYVGVHYPLDIIAGAAFGIATAFLFYFLYNKFIAPYLRLAHLV